MMSGGTMSGRVESSWPNFTNVGPSSSSISRRCLPRSVVEPVSRCRRPSTTKPKPCRTATWAISPRRPMLAVFELVEAIPSQCDRALRQRGNAAGTPPSTGITAPVVARDRSLMRKATASATSAPVTGLPSRLLEA